MVGQNNGKLADAVVIDLNTQVDFLSDDGAYPVTNAAELIPAMRHVVAWTKRNHVPVISSMDSHREGEVENRGITRHCIDGSFGQRKLLFTILGASIQIEGDNTLTVPPSLFSTFQQVIFRQRTRDLFGNPKADRFLTQLPIRRFLVYGVGLETSVKALTLGLLARHRKVTVVADACGYWSKPEADLALRQMEAKGARLMAVAELLSTRLGRRVRYPHRCPANGNGRKTNGRQGGPTKLTKPENHSVREQRRHPD